MLVHEEGRHNKPLQAIVFVGSIVAYLLLGVILWWILDQYIKPDGSTEKKDLFQALGLIMAGVAGVVGVYFTWRNLRQTQEITQATLRLTERGQITERFTRAIDQLGAIDDEGDKRMEIRLGGIYALERIAHDSPTYYGAVTEVLAAYIRVNARISEGEDIGLAMNPDLLLWRRPPADIQTILVLLGGRKEHHVRLYLGRTDLRKAELDGANFRDAELTSSHLERASLRRADFEGADLEGASLWRAELEEINLKGADLWTTRLGGANLRGANLEGANLTGADLDGANLRGANLTGASLYAAQLERVILEDVNLCNTDLRNTDLRQAKGLTQEQLEQAIGDDRTLLPEGFRQPAAWGTHTESQAGKSGTTHSGE